MENFRFILTLVDLILSIYIIILLKRLESKKDKNIEVEIGDELRDRINYIANDFIENEDNFNSSKAEFIEAMKGYISDTLINSDSEYPEIKYLNSSELNNLIGTNLDQYIYENINAIYTDIYEKKMMNTNVVMNKLNELQTSEALKSDTNNKKDNSTVDILNDLINMSN